MADIEDRLKSHSNAFDGLLSLIPANKYFEGDNSSQWNKRKQSKEEKKRAKKAKLDPDAAISAAELRRREQEEGKAEAGEDGDAQLETSNENHAQKSAIQAPKKQKQKKKQQQNKVTMGEEDSAKPESRNGGPEKKPGNQTPKKEKQKQQQDTKAAPTEQMGGELPALVNGEKEVVAKGKGKRKERPEEEQKEPKQQSKKQKNKPSADKEAEQADSDNAEVDGSIQFNGLSQPSDAPPTTTITVVTAEAATSANEPEKPKVDPATRAEQRARLEARIQALRASRKANNADGTPARNRQELMDARRKQAADRKEKKKNMRLEAKAEQLAKAELERASERSGSIVASTDNGAQSRSADNDFSFGMVTFGDGEKVDPTLHRFQKGKKRKGPTDTLGQLRHIEAKNRRIENMDEEKKAEIREKEKWAKALKQAQGEKVKDDEKLLKKSLKKETQKKKKSEREWNERIEGVAKGKAMKQKKREENIQARIDQKKAGKMGRKVKTPGKKVQRNSRPGFEGSMKSGKGSISKKGRK